MEYKYNIFYNKNGGLTVSRFNTVEEAESFIKDNSIEIVKIDIMY